MTLDSSFKHHTGSMRLLLIALTCLAASSALPKGKRDVLHAINSHTSGSHQYENAVKDSRTVGLSSYNVPEVPQDTYGPPGYQPGAPLSAKQYLQPAVQVTKYSTSVSSYGTPDTVHVPETDETYVGHEKTVSSTSLVSDKTIETVSAAPPSTSYGIAAEPTIGNVGERYVKSTDKTVQTEVSSTQELPPTVAKVDKQVPAVQVGTPQLAVGANTVVSGVAGTQNLFGDSLLTESLPSVQASYSGLFNVPSYGGSSYLPPSLYSSELETVPSTFHSFGSFPSGFAGVDTRYSLPSVNHGFDLGFDASLPLSVQIARRFETGYSVPQTVGVPATTFQAPSPLAAQTTHAHHPQDLPLAPCSPPVQSLPSLSHAASLTPVQSTLNTLTLPQPEEALPVSYLKSTKTVTPLDVHTVQPVKTVEPLTSVQHTLHSVQPLPSVEHSVHPVSSVKTVEQLPQVESTVHPVLPVSTVKTVETVSSVEHSAFPVHSVSSLKTVEHLPHVEPTVHSVLPVSTVRTTETLPSVEHSVYPVHSVSSVKTVEHLPQVQHTVHTAQPFAQVRTIDTLPSVEHSVYPVHSVSSVKTVEHLPQVEPTVHSILPVSTVKTIDTLPSVEHSVYPVHSVSSVKTVDHLPQVQHTVHTAQPFAQVRTIDTLPSVEHSVYPVHSVSSVKTVQHLPQVEPTVHSILPVSTVKTIDTLPSVEHSVYPVHSVSSVKTVEHLPQVEPTVHSVLPVSTVRTIETLPSVEHSVYPAQPVSPVKTLTSVKTVSSVHPVESAQQTFGVQHGVVKTNTVSVYHNQPQKGVISDFFENLGENLSLPSLPTFPSLPSFPSFPSLSLPSLPSLLGSSTVAPPVNSPSTPGSVQSDLTQEGVAVENPLLPSLNTAHSVSVAKNYVQPTDANGGYIYRK